MQIAMRRHACAVALLIGAACVSGASVTPVQKVIQMLTGMLEDGKAAKHKEQVQFAAFKQFCDDVTVEKQNDIKGAESRITMLKADLQKHEADVDRWDTEIAQHHLDVKTAQDAIQEAAKVRKTERIDYMAKHQDYSESIVAIQQAISLLKKRSRDRPQAAGLLQIVSSFPSVPASAKHAIESFLAEDPEIDPFSVSAPEANAYEFQSTSIIEMLEKLEDKFIDERTALEADEVSGRHAFETLSQDQHFAITSSTKQIEEKTEATAKNAQAVATLSGDLLDTTGTMNDDQKYLDDLIASCKKRSGDFDKQQDLRAQEIEALDKAIVIISGKAVAGNAEKHLPSLLVRTALAQLRSSRENPNQLRAAAFLKDAGSRIGSHVLSVLAARSTEDPFAKVKKMIQDLISRLQEQATEEAEHKGWCDTELATNEQTRKTKSSHIETLRSEIDELQSSTAKLGQEIADLSQAVAELEAAVAKATAIRETEKATNEATIADAVEAQTALAQAVAILKDFYDKAADATLLVQASAPEEAANPEPPKVADATFKGQQGAKGGVLAMLQVIESDFSRLETDTRAVETTAAEEYDAFMGDTDVDKTQKEKDIAHKKTQKTTQESDIVVKQEDLSSTEKELDAAEAYYEKLRPSCIDVGQSYDGRVSRRKEEIQALHEALRILSGDDIAALQQAK